MHILISLNWLMFVDVSTSLNFTLKKKMYGILYRSLWILFIYFCFWSLRPHNSSSDRSCSLVITLSMYTIWIFWDVFILILCFDEEIFSKTIHGPTHFFAYFFCSFGFATYCASTHCPTSNLFDFHTFF